MGFIFGFVLCWCLFCGFWVWGVGFCAWIRLVCLAFGLAGWWGLPLSCVVWCGMVVFRCGLLWVWVEYGMVTFRFECLGGLI